MRVVKRGCNGMGRFASIEIQPRRRLCDVKRAVRGERCRRRGYVEMVVEIQCPRGRVVATEMRNSSKGKKDGGLLNRQRCQEQPKGSMRPLLLLQRMGPLPTLPPPFPRTSGASASQPYQPYDTSGTTAKWLDGLSSFRIVMYKVGIPLPRTGHADDTSRSQ